MRSPDFSPTLISRSSDLDSSSSIEDGNAPAAPAEVPSLQPLASASDPLPSRIWRLFTHRLFRLAIVIGLHILIFFLVAGLVVFKTQSVPKSRREEAKFQLVKIAPAPPKQKPASNGVSSVKDAYYQLPSSLSPITLPTPRFDFNFPNKLPPVTDAVNGLRLPRHGQNNLESGLGKGLGVQMSQLLFQLPILTNGSCALIDDHSLILHLNDEDIHTCTVLVRGVVEQATYVEGVTDGYVRAGGTPQTGTFNIYELDVDDPPQTYYLNAGKSGISKVFLISYSLTIQIRNGSRLTLHANSIDQLEIPNEHALVVPDTDPHHPLAVQQPYKGQFIQIDAIAVDADTGGNLLAAALKGPQQAQTSDGSESTSIVSDDNHPAAPVAPIPPTPEQIAPSSKPFQPTTAAARPPKSPPYGKVKPVNIDLEQNDESNIWIYVGLNGGRPHRYLLDTGSWGFYALYSPKWWPGDPKSLFKTSGFDTELYGNMTYGYGFVPVFSSVILYHYFNGLQAYQFPERDYGIAKAFAWYDDYEPQKGVVQRNESFDQAIESADENDDDTTDNHGIFGAGTCIQFKGSDVLGYANLSNLLAQVPGDGYVITDNGPLGRATLTIGLNEAIRSQFSQFLSLHPDYGSGGFPNTHWPSYGPPVVQITLSRTGHIPIVFKGSFWIDSGSGDSNVRMPAGASQEFDAYIGTDGMITPGTKINVSDPTRKNGLDYTTVIHDANDTMHAFTGQIAKKETDEIGIWFGIDFFRRNSILYDLKNGVMGFSPRRPELDQSVLDSP